MITLGIIYTLIPISVYFFFRSSPSGNKTVKKIITLALSLILLSFTIPFHPIKGDASIFYSVIDFIFKEKHPALTLMGIFYLLSFILLLRDKYILLSALLFVGGYVASLFATFTDDIGRSAFILQNYPNKIYWIATGIPIFLFILPMPLLFLFSRITAFTIAPKWMQKQAQEYEQMRVETAAIPFRESVKALLFVAIPSTIYALIATYIYDRFHCPSSEVCTLWGEFFSRSAGFWISGIFLFFTIVFATGIGVRKIEAKVARYLLLPVVLLSFLGTYVSFQIYVKTDDKGIYGRDLINEVAFGGDINPVNVSWENIKEVREKLCVGSRCKLDYQYLVLNDGSQIKLPTIVRYDNKFFTFLVQEKGIPYITNANSN